MLDILKLNFINNLKKKKKNFYGKNYMWGSKRSRTKDSGSRF